MVRCLPKLVSDPSWTRPSFLGCLVGESQKEDFLGLNTLHKSRQPVGQVRVFRTGTGQVEGYLWSSDRKLVGVEQFLEIDRGEGCGGGGRWCLCWGDGLLVWGRMKVRPGRRQIIRS